MTRRWPAILALVVLVPEGVASGGGVRDLEDAWLVAAPAVFALLDAPARATPSWHVRLAHGRLYGLPDLDQVGLEFARRWRAGAATAAWERLGRDLYREDIWRTSVLLGSSWRCGVGARIAALAVGGEPVARSCEFDLALQATLAEALQLQAWLPLTPPPVWYGRDGLRRWLLLQGSGEGWVWSAVADRSARGTPSLQGEVLLRVAPGAALGLRCEPATGTVGICTAWRTAGILLRSSHCVHPELGASHRWSLVLGGGR